MIAGLARAFDNLFGRGEAAVTVPPLDGAMMPNRALDEAEDRQPLDGVDDLAVTGGTLVASAGARLMELASDGTWRERRVFDAPIAALASMGPGGLAVALESGAIVLESGTQTRTLPADRGLGCITAMVHKDGALFIANGSATNTATDWRRDLLERNASGSVWRLETATGKPVRIADDLAWPAGLAADGDGVVVSEAWKHRLIRLDLARPDVPQVLNADFPGYPGRLSPCAEGHWLALFAPRSQLVEFVLREPAFRKRMMAEVPEPYWIAPKLRAGRSFYEAMQGGGVKHLGILKPWAPTMSAGFCVRLDAGFQPRASLQSRADGQTHGVTSAIEHEGRLHVAARGDDVIVALPLGTDGGAGQ